MKWFFKLFKKKEKEKKVEKEVKGSYFNVKGELNIELDSLYLKVSDILGLYLSSFKSNIEVCNVKNKFRELFNHETDIKSFYLKDNNTIYVNPGVSEYILGHEIAHALINNYFVIHVPEKMQEINAGYVEYQLRKQQGE